ncbi:MAG: mechanosensitive ion channel family protein [Chitinophagaceae bacterium]
MNDFWHRVVFEVGSFRLTTARLAGVIAVIFVVWLLLMLVRRLLLHRSSLTPNEKGRRASVYQLLRYLAWVITVSFCITILGFDVTLLVAGSAALLVGLGFGLQNIFSDLVSGLFMLFERKVKVGDVMEVDNIVGIVQQINLRTSVLLTRDGFNIIVPNHKFITDNVINWSHQTFDRRFQLEVGVSYDSDVKLVTDILLQCAEEQDELIKVGEHKPFVRFHDFGDSALIFYLMFWTQDIFRVEHVKSLLRYKILAAFREHHVTIPFPQRDVHLFPKG